MVNFRRVNEKKPHLIFCSSGEKGILHMLFKDIGLHEISDLITISPSSRTSPNCSSQTRVWLVLAKGRVASKQLGWKLVPCWTESEQISLTCRGSHLLEVTQKKLKDAEFWTWLITWIKLPNVVLFLCCISHSSKTTDRCLTCYGYFTTAGHFVMYLGKNESSPFCWGLNT